LSMRQQSADAMAVLAACGLESAVVFGNSGGATIALDLAARHPSAFPVVVAHEPPLPRLLPDDARTREYVEIFRVLDSDGWRAAFTLFQTRLGDVPEEQIRVLLDPAQVLAPGPDLDLMTRMSGNWEYLVTYEMRSYIGYDPDFDAIRAGGSRVVLAAGTTSDPVVQAVAAEVAARLGSAAASFPGGHTAPMTIPDKFAARLQEVLAGPA
jgi:pimeloyl-ACP methyl ester carboxylesterase